MTAGRQRNSPANRSHLVALLVSGAFTIVAIMMLAGWSILNEKNDAHSTAEAATTNISQILADNFNATVRQIDLGMLALADEVSTQLKNGQKDENELNAAIARETKRHSESLGFRIYGADGKLRSNVGDIGNPSADMSAEDDFRYLRDTPTSGLVVTSPRVGKVTRLFLIGLGRRITNPDGSFGGAVYSGISTHALTDQFAALDLGRGGIVALHHVSFVMAARFPEIPATSGSLVTVPVGDPLRKIIESNIQFTQYDYISPLDAVHRTAAVRRILGQPYYVLVGLAEDDYLAHWRYETIRTLMFGGATVGLVLLGMLVLHRKISERERLERGSERERLRLQTILKTASDGIHVLDSDGVLIEANDAFLGMLRYDASVVSKLRAPDWDVTDAWEVIKGRNDDLIARRGKEVFEARYRRRDNAVLDVEISASGIEIEGKGYLYAASRDISERKREHEELEYHRQHLEELVFSRTAQLKAANQELDSFANAVSHDLRAPLRAMMGFSEALVEDFGDGLEEGARTYLAGITSAGRQMRELINGLLQLSRDTIGELRRQRVDLSALSESVRKDLETGEPGRRVNWSIEHELSGWGDRRMIEVVLRNLLTNAWKYTGKSAEPAIRVYKETREGHQFICVADNGAGFNEKSADKLFKPFQRLHRQDEYPGIGIGLSTVWRIIQRHGGTILAEGSVGKGATFKFHLPGRGDEATSCDDDE